jgi:hypothetical protein
LTIKSADAYQINVATDFIFDPAIDPESAEAPRIGIFDCNGKYLQDIGSLVLPDCSQTYETKVFYDFVNDDFILWSNIQSASSLSDIFLQVYLVNANSTESFIDEFSVGFGPGKDLDSTTVSGFCTQLQTLIIGLGYDCIITFVAGDRPEINIEINANVCEVIGIDYKFRIVSTIGANLGLYTPITPKLGGSQYQASITIPPLANGIYRIGIYQGYTIDDEGFSELLAISQPLELDNFETFTQILEYGSAKDSIIEGFEYLNGWIQRIRVALNGAGQTYALEESIYRNSDGTFQKPQNSTDEIIYLHTDYFDLKTQRAMTSATRHPIFVLANQNLSVQGDLEIATNQDYTTNQSFRKLQQMRFQAKNQGYQPNNNSCLG